MPPKMKIPILYKECARMLKEIILKRNTLKSEIYSNKKHKSHYPLLQKVLINYDLLDSITAKCKYNIENKYLSVVLCYETLTRKYKNPGWIKKFSKARGKERLQKRSEKKVFIRINTMKTKAEDAVKELASISGNMRETKIKDVYEASNKKSIVCSNLYKDGKIFIQNLASCLPAHILNPTENSKVIDACAAPGNKTTHLSMIMNNTGLIYAIEINKDRFHFLKKQVDKSGAKNTECINSDFTDTSPEVYNADYVLLDAPCSGSGFHDYYKIDEKRIKSLQSLQVALLKHAMKFSAKRIVYSVCSVHQEEGEDVIKEALLGSQYEVEKVEDFGAERGFEGYEFSERVLRFKKNISVGLTGFFIASLLRKQECTTELVHK